MPLLLETIKKSRNVLVVAPKEIEGDNFCAIVALFYTLNKLGKNVNLILPKLLKNLNFLINEDVLKSLNQSSITISINTKGEKIEKIFYEKAGNELKFNLDLKNGAVNIENISFKIKEGADLIINIKNNDIILVGKDCDNETSIINNYGGSVCEKMTSFLKTDNEDLIDGNIATCLLAGIISYTQNFQKDSIKPFALGQASYLIERGANYQKIIQVLYKTKTISEMKLFGKVLSKINLSKNDDIAYCSLSQKDFKEINSSSRDLKFILEALKNNFTLPKTIFILWEKQFPSEMINGLIYSLKDGALKGISNNFPALIKNNCAIFSVKNNSLTDSENKILNILK